MAARPHVDPDGSALLSLHAPEARQVHLASDFNGWDPTSHPLERHADGTWTIRTPRLERAPHTPVVVCYKFVVDGEIWSADPSNPLRVRDDSALRVPAEEPWTATSRGRVWPDAAFNSRHLGRAFRYAAWIPPGYDREPSRRYPVLFLLHDRRDAGPMEWLLKANLPEILDILTEMARIPPMVVVMPDLEDGLAVDRYDGGASWERAFVDELVPHVDSAFRTRANRRSRAVGGVSGGGYSAMKLALQYPWLFCSVHSQAGYFDVRDAALWPEIFGPGEGSMPHRRWNSPAHLVEDPPRTETLRLSLGCGEEDPLFEASLRFHEILSSRAIPHTFWSAPGHHAWDVVQRMLPAALEEHGVAFRGRVPLKGSVTR